MRRIGTTTVSFQWRTILGLVIAIFSCARPSTHDTVETGRGRCFGGDSGASPDSVACVEISKRALVRAGAGTYPYVSRYQVDSVGVLVLLTYGPPETHMGGGGLVRILRNDRVKIVELYQ